MNETLDIFLRRETSALHRRTEQALEPLKIFKEFSLDRYTTFLRIQYEWHILLESYLEKYLDPRDYTYQLKSDYLKNDLGSLHQNDGIVNHSFQGPHTLAGILYVLEGSMLGGAVISKYLVSKQVPPDYRTYFTYCADTARYVWPTMKNYLRNRDDNYNEFNNSLKTAERCFELMIELTQIEVDLMAK